MLMSASAHRSKPRLATHRAVPTLLIVDDEAHIRRSLVRVLSDQSFRVIEVACAEAALEVLRRESVQVIVADHNMAGMTGLDLLRSVRLRHPTVVRMMLTANDDVDVCVRAINLGEVHRLVRKPWKDDELCCTVRQAFEHAALEHELRILRKQARRQLADLRELEALHPGILSVRRDETGAINLESNESCDEASGRLVRDVS
ncbi:MAG: hypothetical protein NVS3B20_20110 [Polyangiales bacterium]